ncbi:MAG: PAS domain S-box protein [Deltaproteobacteria bacterium]|nr:PAS domain S-box protein [Deltaproteobacteria bacterium]
MAENNKSKDQLIAELAELRLRKDTLIEALEARCRRSEQALRIETEFNDSLIQSSPVLFIAVAPDGTVLFMNEMMLTTLGYSCDEVIGLDYVNSFVPEHDRTRTANIFKQAALSKTGILNEHPVMTKDGRELLVEWHGRSVYKNDGELNFFFAVGIDITDRRLYEKSLRRAYKDLERRYEGKITELHKTYELLRHEMSERQRVEEALQERDERYWSTFHANPSSLTITRINDGRYIQVNEGFLRQAGYKKEEIIGKTPFDLDIFVNPGDRQRFISILKDLGEVSGFELKYRTKDGISKYTLLSAKPIRFDGEDCLITVVTDISELKRTEESLRESEEENRLIVENASDGIFVFQAGVIKFVNPRGIDITGYSPGELNQKPFFDLVHSDDLPLVRSIFLEPKTKEAAGNRYPIRLLHQSGHPVWAEITAVPITWEARPAVLSFLRDINAQKQLEMEQEKLEGQLRQAQKIQAIGTLAGGIAHDFNNILAAIIGYSEMALNEAVDTSRSHRWLTRVMEASHRAKELVNQILMFSRQDEKKRRSVEIATVVKEALKLVRASIPSTIEIKLDISSDTGFILADPTQIHQVIMNLATNAAHAMDADGGILSVEISDLIMEEGKMSQGLSLKPGHYVELSIGDTGSGMTQEVRDRIFEPFFTTKDQGEGTGMGLSVVHGIVKSHDGGIDVFSEPGKGSTFHLYFPKMAGSRPEETPVTGQIPTGHEPILFIDDESMVADMAKDLLENLGYLVTAMTDPIEALEIFCAKPGRFDLIITDQTMPKLVGIELAKRVFAFRPEIPVILCIGFDEPQLVEKAKLAGICQIIVKPFSKRELAELIRQVLDEK